ncbi:hypothetical protein ElyMa_005310700 [Elysia marginata]|uniref:Uncharacterized protein n=1 Tax=Elysia marginata TaxID=1093978 RepID=A0AAV4K3S9_9GAST|nr:hypothetical protein ElyMa_005310700 [Elysia marginata]
MLAQHTRIHAPAVAIAVRRSKPSNQPLLVQSACMHHSLEHTDFINRFGLGQWGPHLKQWSAITGRVPSLNDDNDDDDDDEDDDDDDDDDDAVGGEESNSRINLLIICNNSNNNSNNNNNNIVAELFFLTVKN